MTDQGDPLARIAAALERIVPPDGLTDWQGSPAYSWGRRPPREIDRIEAPLLDELLAIDVQKRIVTQNILRLAQGHAAHDMLLWGARGMGKSALLRSGMIAAQTIHPGAIALVQVAIDALPRLPDLFAILAKQDRNFLVYMDDLGFAPEDTAGPRQLRSWLEGGVDARPTNVRLAVTSNRRSIVPREAAEQSGALNPRDALDDALALADRFGLTIGFHNCSRDEYLEIVSRYAATAGLRFEPADALEWAIQRGARSGRTAWQYITELAGRAGIAL
ncbi:DUF815 domain-containing protein [Altererythrobacter aquiaggeris]|uniref:DUF815 domain-containing protein n=1 Tax=Aestuarierythrobacter aquiaggeris TaxID=1898396 RepID=UPI00301731E5